MAWEFDNDYPDSPTVYCVECDEWVDRDDSVATKGGDLWCRWCFEAATFECEGCFERCPEDDQWTVDGLGYCSGCVAAAVTLYKNETNGGLPPVAAPTIGALVSVLSMPAEPEEWAAAA